MAKKRIAFVGDFQRDLVGSSREETSRNLSVNSGRVLTFASELGKDLKFATSQLRREDCQEARRAYIRTACSYVEGWTTALRAMIYSLPPLLDRIPSEFRELFAESVVSDVRAKGGIKHQIKGTFAGVAAIAGTTLPSGLMGESGAQDLLSTFDARNLLMHPKSHESFVVGDRELAAALSGLDWFNKTRAHVWSSFTAELERRRRQPE